MIRTPHSRRGGFTLVELLVGMSIFLALAGLVLLLYPGARDQDRVRYAVSDVGAHLRMAQSMAARDKAPRGLRFLVTATPADPNVSTDTTNPDKTDPRWVTELQYVEQPLPLIPNRNPYTSGNLSNEPRVRFEYDVQPSGMTAAPPAGTITRRHCYIENLKREEADLIKTGCTIVMPVFSAWHKIKAITDGPREHAPTNSGRWFVEAELEVYPDAIMGGSSHAQTHHFAIYLLPTPLVGEPTIPLPKNICVDLNVSAPATAGATDFDVLFGPDGKLVNAPGGQIFLWVRDYTKQVPYSGTGGGMNYLNDTSTPTLLQALQRGGEQHIISVRASGSHGHNSVTWPDQALGRWQTKAEPFNLARQEIRQ